MEERILVAYANHSGATQGVVTAIAQTLAETGMHVDVCAVRDRQS